MLRVENLGKSFTLHLRGGGVLPVFEGVSFGVGAGECVVLAGPSGAGKSSLVRVIYGNYAAGDGRVLVRHDGREIDLAAAGPRTVIAVRRRTLGHVSQFLRVVPRVPAAEVVAEPLRALGVPADEARERATALLARLRIPERLWSLPPATFSGGERQRVNLARGFVVGYPILLLDEPTASLDAANRETVMTLIEEAKARGTAVLGVFHDRDVRERVATREVDLEAFGIAA